MWTFILALLAHIYWLLAGIAFFIADFFTRFFPKMKLERVPWKWIGAFCIVVAMFNTWNDQYEKRKELEKVKPDFRIGIIRQAVGDVEKNRVGIQVVVSIRNLGKMPSIAGGWQLSLFDRSGKPVNVEQIYLPGTVTMKYADGREEIFTEADSIEDKTMAHPIIVGGYVQGLLHGILPGLKEPQGIMGYTIVVDCYDVFDTKYSATYKIPERVPPLELKRIPGLKSQKVQ